MNAKTPTQAIRDFLTSRADAYAAGHDISTPTQAMKHALHALHVIVEDADRLPGASFTKWVSDQAKLDACIIADLTAEEAEALWQLDEGVVDIAADDARALRLAKLIEGAGDDYELTPRGGRIARKLAPRRAPSVANLLA